MPLHLTYKVRELHFTFQAKTSRGSLSSHMVYYLALTDANDAGCSGIGEAAPLAGLSIDAIPGFEVKLKAVCEEFNAEAIESLPVAINWLKQKPLENWPAIKFGLETAFLDFEKYGSKSLFDSPFSRGEAGLPINGLIWMGDKNFMQEQICRKLAEGYTTIKLKIGGLDFKTECEILDALREIAGPDRLTLRLDANGAFTAQNAMEKLEKLAKFNIHSLEQPIQPGQYIEMAKICKESPIPIALDEELIGLTKTNRQAELLETLKPAYVILKPTLLGGLEETRKWIGLAETRKIGWWLTSALESNIGLNAIAQFTATFSDLLPQGLGTGQLYHNNIKSPLTVKKGFLYYNSGVAWQTNDIH